ncbi:MAG: hypothetical protein ACOYD0_06065 [Candidatus Nanopelagicales bacterium]
MLEYEDETARKLFAVYVRPEGERGEINFYADEAEAIADVGPGMPAGVITHGDVYVETIGDALLFAPEDWPIIGVDQDLLVQLQADAVEIFIALTPAESDALMLLASGEASAVGEPDMLATVIAEDTVDEADDDAELVDPPAGVEGTQPCVTWMGDGSLVLFESGADAGGHVLAHTQTRPEFGDEVESDRAIVALLERGWVPFVDDPHTWLEVEDAWVLNIQSRTADADEQFFGRYTADDRTLVVTRAGADTGFDEEHLQVISEDVDDDFIDLGRALVSAGWKIDPESDAAAEQSDHPELRESPGWFPAETEEGTEWVCALVRIVAA